MSGSGIDVHVAAYEGGLTLTFHEDSRPAAGVWCDYACIYLGRLKSETETYMDFDVRRFRDELKAMLESADITGTARFASIEDDFRVSIELRHGTGTLSIWAGTDFSDCPGEAWFRLTTDQAALQNTVAQLNRLLQAYPAL